MGLIKDAIFRPQVIVESSGRFSLDIQPLAELADMYHGCKAADPRDKVFALLGMSTDDPIITGLLADYEASWDNIMRKLVQSSLSSTAIVTTWESKEVVVIKVKGCVLGRVVSSGIRSKTQADRQTIDVTWANPTIPSYQRQESK